MTSLIVVFSSAAAPSGSEWSYAVTPDGRTVTDHGSAPLALLPRADEIVGVVPMRQLSWHRVDLPRASSGRMRAALDGLLEERLLDEPSALHLALEPLARPGTPAWVAACDKAWLQSTLQAFESAQRPVTRIVPEYSPGPRQACVTGTAGDAWLVTTDPDGVCALPLSGAAAVPADLVVHAEPAVAALAERTLDRKVEIVQPAQRWLLASQTSWDLAQFDLASSGSGRFAKRAGRVWRDILTSATWRPARWGVITLVAAHLLGLNAWAWREKSSLDTKRDAVRAVLTQTFPGVRVVVDAPVQMEREVVALRQATGAFADRDLEAMLGSAAKVLPAQITVAGVEYAGGELTLKVRGLAASDAATLSEKLAVAGYSARIDGERLTIKTGASR